VAKESERVTEAPRPRSGTAITCWICRFDDLSNAAARRVGRPGHPRRASRCRNHYGRLQFGGADLTSSCQTMTDGARPPNVGRGWYIGIEPPGPERIARGMQSPASGGPVLHRAHGDCSILERAGRRAAG